MDDWPYDEHPGDCHPRVVAGAWTTCCPGCAGTGVFPVPWVDTIEQGRADPDAGCVACKETGRAIVTFAAYCPSTRLEHGDTGPMTEHNHIARATLTIELRTGDTHTLHVDRPNPRGDNPRFMGQQLASALASLRARATAVLTAYSDQAPITDSDDEWLHQWLTAFEACLGNPDDTHLLNSLNALEHGAPTTALSRAANAAQRYVRRVQAVRP